MTAAKALIHFLLIVCMSIAGRAQTQPVELQPKISVPFRFAAYGDTRFTNPKDTEAANPIARQMLADAIGSAQPAFISIGGDIAYNGYDTNDWKIYDKETAAWAKIPVYPALGNHDLHGDHKIALGNYFQRFPELQNNRYYSVRAANTLLLVLDSSQAETSGPQGDWLAHKLETLPSDVDFVCLVMHHPPYTDSSDHALGGGHSARAGEQTLAKTLEEKQQHIRARIVVFAGHVHNYERHEHNGVTYFVTGGGGAQPYPIRRKPGDPLYGKDVNYHYLLTELDHGKMKITMNRLELANGKASWTTPDTVEVTTPAEIPAKATK